MVRTKSLSYSSSQDTINGDKTPRGSATNTKQNPKFSNNEMVLLSSTKKKILAKKINHHHNRLSHQRVTQ